MMVQHDAQHGADPFLQCSIFSDGFFQCFPRCSFEVCQSALMLSVTFAASQFHSAGKAVCFECVFVCVSLPVRYDPPLYSGTCVTVFLSFCTLLLVYLGRGSVGFIHADLSLP